MAECCSFPVRRSICAARLLMVILFGARIIHFPFPALCNLHLHRDIANDVPCCCIPTTVSRPKAVNYESVTAPSPKTM
ncbi:hypothetical protein DFH06DRAFT_1225629, partial [Mycena polygramma]